MKHCYVKTFKTFNQICIYECTYSIEKVSFYAFIMIKNIYPLNFMQSIKKSKSKFCKMIT